MNEDLQIKEELAKMNAEPILPVEKKLIGISLVVGFLLLSILIWISYTYFPAGR